jgi:hypothetical protein
LGHIFKGKTSGKRSKGYYFGDSYYIIHMFFHNSKSKEEILCDQKPMKIPRSRLEASLFAGIVVGEEIADIRSDYTLPLRTGERVLGPYPDLKMLRHKFRVVTLPQQAGVWTHARLLYK